jgi:MFS family permease
MELLTSLRRPAFRRFFIGQSVSLLGTWMRGAALGWMSFSLTGSEFALGLTFTLNTLPLLLFSPWAGGLADQIPKRRIVAASSLLSMAASLALALWWTWGQVPVQALWAFATVYGLAQAFEMPARQSMIVELAGKQDLSNAIALNSAAFNLTRVAGPALGGLLLGVAGPAWCFAADALSFVAVLWALAGDDGRMGAALRYVRESPQLGRTLGLLLVMSLFGWSLLSQLPAFASKHLGLSASGYGWLMAANASGAAATALWVASHPNPSRPIRLMGQGIALAFTSMIFLGWAQSWQLAVPLLMSAGAGMLLFFATGNTSLQAQVPDALRGRVMGLWAMIFGGSMPLGSLLLGLMAERWGSARAIQVAGLFAALCAGAVWKLVPDREL